MFNIVLVEPEIAPNTGNVIRLAANTGCAMCSNMVEMAQATMHMMMRPAGMDMDVMKAMMMACMTMGKACADECRMHADMDEMCRYCAMACDDMVMKCEAMMASMTA